MLSASAATLPQNLLHPPPALIRCKSALIATDRLRVQWTQSSDVRYSRAEVKQGGNVLSFVENDTDQLVMFSGLQPNQSHAIAVCVRNEDQTAESETCRSITARTLPLIPLAPSSVGVDQADPNPRKRTIIFSIRQSDSQRRHRDLGSPFRRQSNRQGFFCLPGWLRRARVPAHICRPAAIYWLRSVGYPIQSERGWHLWGNWLHHAHGNQTCDPTTER